MKDKLVKLLNLTRSSNDAEALSAIRKANDLISTYDTGWDELLNVKPAMILRKDSHTRPKPPPPTQTVQGKFSGERVEFMLDEYSKEAERNSKKENSFMQSLCDWYDDKGFLTEKQYNALEKWYERETGIN